MKPIEFNICSLKRWEEWSLICIPRMKFASKLRIPHLPQFNTHPGICAIVGAGSSLEKDKSLIERIKELKAENLNIVMTVNAAHAWLIDQGVKPNIHVIFEDDIDDIQVPLGGVPHNDVAYYICSHCDQKVFQQLEGNKRVLWHTHYNVAEYQQIMQVMFPREFMVSGGYATLFRSITIATILGYREFEFFGVDSSFEEQSHVSGYKFQQHEPEIEVFVGPDRKRFLTKGSLAFQATEFMEFCRVNHSGLRIKVHGDGMLSYMHRNRYPDQYKED